MKNPAEGCTGLFKSGTFEPVTTQQIAALMIHHRQRIAPDSVEKLELPFVISGPEIVDGVHWGKRLRKGGNAAFSVTLGHASLGVQNLVDRGF